MKHKKQINTIALMVIGLPLLIYVYLLNFDQQHSHHINFHLFYVLGSSLIAFLLGIAAFLEFKRDQVDKIFFIALGFIGVGVFYSFHALLTPGLSLFTLIDFTDPIKEASAFVMAGDVSRLWLAFMIFVPDSLLKKRQHWKKYLNGYTLLAFAVLLPLLAYLWFSTPALIPNFKNSDLSDTTIAILIKIVTLLIIGVNTLKYYYPYKAKSNLTILSFVVGLVLIMETVILFLISKPWTSVWWLAHNLFLASYVIIGCGVIYSLFGKEKYGFFDVFGQIEQYMTLLEEKNKELDIIANLDFLTGLSNRRHFLTLAEEHIKTAKNNMSSFAFMFIDLDYFKEVNDEFGHKTGDELLKILSNKITGLIKSTDIASRVGGDEFVLLLKDVEQVQLENIAKRLVERLNEPVVIHSHHCQIGVSIGVSQYPQDGTTVDELFAKSDEAMYHVKQSGRNGYSFIALK